MTGPFVDLHSCALDTANQGFLMLSRHQVIVGAPKHQRRDSNVAGLRRRNGLAESPQ